MNEVAQDNQPGKKNYRTLKKSTTKRVELPCCAGLAKKRQVVVSCEILLQKVESSSTFCNETCTSVADPGARFSKVPIINGPGKLSPFTLKIEVSIVLNLT